VPLLAENNLAAGYDLVVVVDAPEQTQFDRLTGRRAMSAEQARARMAAQASRARRLAIADMVIDNSGSLADLDQQVSGLWEKLRRRARRAGDGGSHSDRRGSLQWRGVVPRVRHRRTTAADATGRAT